MEVRKLHFTKNTSVTNAIYSPSLIYSSPFVSDSEISGRWPARQRLHDIAGSLYSNIGLHHVVVNNFLDSKAQTLFFLCWKRPIIWLACSFASSCLNLEHLINIWIYYGSIVNLLQESWKSMTFFSRAFIRTVIKTIFMQAGRRPAKSIYSTLRFDQKWSKGSGINSVSDWYLKINLHRCP